MTARRRPSPAGDYDQRIRIQRRAPGVDALRQASGAWLDVTEVWAKARPLSTRELHAASQQQLVADVVFEVRYGVTIDPATNRVLWLDGSAAGLPCQIVGRPLQPNGARADLHIHCVSGVGDGR